MQNFFKIRLYRDFRRSFFMKFDIFCKNMNIYEYHEYQATVCSKLEHGSPDANNGGQTGLKAEF